MTKTTNLCLCVLLIFCLLFSMPVAAQTVKITDMIKQEGLLGTPKTNITIKDTKQPHVVWDFPDEEEKELLNILDKVDLTPVNAIEKTQQEYLLNIGTDFGLWPYTIYSNGYVVMDKSYFVINNFGVFHNKLNSFLTTQSKGYGNSMPSHDKLVEISEWAVEIYQSTLDKNLIPEYMKVGYMTDNITREQFCDLISILLKNHSEQDIANTSKKNFQDTNSQNVAFLVERNIIMGKSETNFAPNDFLTREEAATILCRTFNCLEQNAVVVKRAYIYQDDRNIAEWAKNAVYQMKDSGIMIGTDLDIFSPKDTFSKEEAITTVLRISKYIK